MWKEQEEKEEMVEDRKEGENKRKSLLGLHICCLVSNLYSGCTRSYLPPLFNIFSIKIRLNLIFNDNFFNLERMNIIALKISNLLNEEL